MLRYLCNVIFLSLSNPLRFNEWRGHELDVSTSSGRKVETKKLKFETSAIYYWNDLPWARFEPQTFNNLKTQKNFRSVNWPCPNWHLTYMYWQTPLSELISDLLQPNRPSCPSGSRPLGPKSSVKTTATDIEMYWLAQYIIQYIVKSEIYYKYLLLQSWCLKTISVHTMPWWIPKMFSKVINALTA